MQHKKIIQIVILKMNFSLNLVNIQVIYYLLLIYTQKLKKNNLFS